MRISGTACTVVALIVLAVVGGGMYAFRTVQETKKQEALAQQQKHKTEQKAAEAKTKDAEAKAKEADARKAEADRKRKEAEEAAKKTQLATLKQEEANHKAKSDAAMAETKKADALRRAAEAETAKHQAAKAAADAAAAAHKKRAEAEAIARDKAIAEQKKAEASLAEKIAVKSIADAALAKSENERKVAEATAAAEHDRKLRMYARANTSRAELLQLQRAEKLLALEESGMLEQAEEVNGDDDAPPVTNAVVNVKWPEERYEKTVADEKVDELRHKLNERMVSVQTVHARKHINYFSKLASKADEMNRAADAKYYRSTLISLVPNYVEEYCALMNEARKNGDASEAAKRIDELIAIVPDWQRVSVFVDLMRLDEDYYSRELAGRISKDEYVKTFRKIYDEARRDKGDRDERDAKVEHICKVLATYVPDFENSPEWK